MRTSPFKLTVASALMLAAVVVAWVILSSMPPITLTVLNYTTNQWSDELASQVGSRTYVSAVIAVTNNSDQTFTYSARGLSHLVEYEILRQTPQGWKAPGSFRCGTGLTRHALLPRHGFTFEAVVDSNTPCKIEFGYSDGRQPNQIWYRLPSWLTQRVPWFSPWRTATTEPIDLSKPRT